MSRRRYAVTLASVLLSLWHPTSTQAQANRPHCPAAEAKRFDFMVGDWHGQEYSFPKGQRDSVKGDGTVAHNRKTADCQFEEHVTFTPPGVAPIPATILRVFDRASNGWMYGLVDGFLELAIFSGTQTDSGWVFSHDLTTSNPPRRIHTSWMPTPTGYMQITRTSTDSGKTWSMLYHTHYVRN